MIGTSISEYIFIRASIIALRLVAPLSSLYLATVCWKGTFIPSSWIGWYAIAEYAFFTLVYLPRRRILQKPAKHPHLDLSQRRALVEKCLNHAEDLQAPSGWFYQRPLSTIKRDNFIEWAYWAIFSVHHNGEAAQEFQGEMEECIRIKERCDGRKLEPGHEKNVKAVKVTLDPVVMVHRPLVWYLIVGILDLITSLVLYFSGFKHYGRRNLLESFPLRPLVLFSRSSPVVELSYWYRPHRSNTKHPVVFIHGVGIGLWPYLQFLRSLASQDLDVGILAIEFLPISSRITSPPLDSQITCQNIERILDFHALSRFVVVSHSYGTAVTAHIFRSPLLSSRVAATLFVDPINFLLHHPSVAYNFLYRSPRSANEWQLWYFASRDPDIARTLGRHFFWTECILWKEDLAEKNISIVLSEMDQIVDTRSVRKYLTGKEDHYWQENGLEVLWYAGLDHATVFDTEQRMKPLLDIVNRFTMTTGN